MVVEEIRKSQEVKRISTVEQEYKPEPRVQVVRPKEKQVKYPINEEFIGGKY